MEIISLDEQDDLISLQDRLTFAARERTLLLLPDNGRFRSLDWVKLRRFIDQQRLEVGIVADQRTERLAIRSAGIPVFSTLEQAQTSRRGWWRGRRRWVQLGLPSTSGEERPFPSTSQSTSQPANQNPLSRRTVRLLWLFRYATIFLFFIALALIFVAFAYSVPGATVTLRPELQPFSASRQITADPTQTNVDYATGIVPARAVQTAVSWQTTGATSGTITLPGNAARGQVIFTNQQEQAVAIPVGSVVQTADGVRFTTQEAALLADAADSTAEVLVVAEEAGPVGNIAAEQILFVDETLAEQVTVRNPEPITGGDLVEQPAVAATDIETLRTEAVQFAEALAQSELELQLTEREFLPSESLRLISVVSEQVSAEVGAQAAEVTVEVTAEFAATAIDLTQATGLAYDGLAAAIKDGFVLVPESIEYRAGEVAGVDEAGRVLFEVVAEGQGAAVLVWEDAVAAVAGQERDIAAAYLQARLPLRDEPTIRLSPNWFNRMPYWPVRIETVVQAEL